MKPKTLLSRIKTPDGTILESRHQHDYQTHTDKVTGEEYMIDGGNIYRRQSVNDIPAEDISLTTHSPFKEIRENVEWTSYGKYGNEPPTTKPVKDLTEEHICAILRTQVQLPEEVVWMFQQELKWRLDNE